MARFWDSAIRQTKELTIARATNTSGWAATYATAIIRFNALSSALSLGVTFRELTPDPENLKSANVEFATANGKVTFAFGGVSGSAKLDGDAKHAFTQPIANPNGELVKQFIFVPAKMQHNFLRLCVTVHELIHATGLDNGDHSDDGDPDIFCESLTPSGSGVQAVERGSCRSYQRPWESRVSRQPLERCLCVKS